MFFNYLINKLLDIWKNDPINNLRTMLRNLDNEYLEFDNDTQKLLSDAIYSYFSLLLQSMLKIGQNQWKVRHKN